MESQPQVKTAEVSQRIIAYVIDGALLMGVCIVISILGTIVGHIPVLGLIVNMLLMLCMMIVSWGYCFLKDGLYDGRSIGKKIIGLRVVTDSGQQCSWIDSLKRNLLMLISPVELIVLLTSKDGKRLGDQWACTKVIAEPCTLQWGEFTGKK